MIAKLAVQHAATLLTELKHNPGMKLKDFCAKTGLTKPFMEQVGLQLVRAEILRSNRGPGGGYVLNKETVTLADLVRTFEPKVRKYSDELNTKAINALETIQII